MSERMETSIVCEYSRRRGLLRLSQWKMAFEAEDSSAPLFECDWTQLEADKYAPETDPKARARITLKADASKHHIFTFSSKEDMNVAKKFIKQRKHALEQERSSGNTTHSVEDIRRELLYRDVRLQQQYVELVESGILREEEFWTGVDSLNQLEIDQREVDALHSKGKLSTLYSDYISKDNSPETNAELKAHIFSMCKITTVYPFIYFNSVHSNPLHPL